jgi:hypothetical protein
MIITPVNLKIQEGFKQELIFLHELGIVLKGKWKILGEFLRVISPEYKLKVKLCENSSKIIRNVDDERTVFSAANASASKDSMIYKELRIFDGKYNYYLLNHGDDTLVIVSL